MNIKRLFSKFSRRTKIIVIFLILGFGYFFYQRSKSQTPLETATITRDTIQEELVLSGEVKASEHAHLAFQSNGELAYLGVSEGQKVEKGEVLARLNTTILYQAYLQAEADLRRYQASLDATYDEVKGNDTDESFEQKEIRTIAETNKDKAYRAYVAASQNLANVTLKAPFAGVITSLTYPFTGINTILSQPQIEILNPETLYFDMTADQSEVTNIALGQKVKIILDSYPSDEYEGEVSYISFTPKSGEVGTSYKVKVAFKSRNVDIQKVRVGMSGDAKIIISEKSDVLSVPPKFVKSDSNGRYLNFEKKNNKRYIEVGIEGEDKVEVTGDIKEGDIVFD